MPPDAAVISALMNWRAESGLGALALILAYFAWQAFFGARGRNSAYPSIDPKHEANVKAIAEVREELTELAHGIRNELHDLNRNSVGALANVQTAIQASDRNHERRENDRMTRLEQMHSGVNANLEIIKDRTGR